MKISRVLFIILALLMPASAPAVDNTSVADLEMLEFLGTFQTGRGKPVDPMLFKKDDSSNRKPESKPEQGKKRTGAQQKNKSQDKGREDEN